MLKFLSQLITAVIPVIVTTVGLVLANVVEWLERK